MRRASAPDAAHIARLLDAFNREYDDFTPGPERLTARIAELLMEGDTEALLAGDGPDGLAILRFRRSLWLEGLECYLAELYVVPSRRRQGIGRGLMGAAIALARECGASSMDLNTAETDLAARALYERLGFSNREGKPNGPVNIYYELPL